MIENADNDAVMGSQ